MDSMTIAMIDAEWFANDTTTQDQVEAWNEYASEGDDATAVLIGDWEEYAEVANYDDHITDVMDGMVEEWEEGR